VLSAFVNSSPEALLERGFGIQAWYLAISEVTTATSAQSHIH